MNINNNNTSQKPEIHLTLKQANAILRCINSEYNDAIYMLKDKEIDKAVSSLGSQIEKIESGLKEINRKDYERKNKVCWYCKEKGTIKHGLCTQCLMSN